jgi:hypothetical protein
MNLRYFQLPVLLLVSHLFFYIIIIIIIIITKCPVHELESSRNSILGKLKLNSALHSCIPQNMCYS